MITELNIASYNALWIILLILSLLLVIIINKNNKDGDGF